MTPTPTKQSFRLEHFLNRHVNRRGFVAFVDRFEEGEKEDRGLPFFKIERAKIEQAMTMDGIDITIGAWQVSIYRGEPLYSTDENDEDEEDDYYCPPNGSGSLADYLGLYPVREDAPEVEPLGSA